MAGYSDRDTYLTVLLFLARCRVLSQIRDESTSSFRARKAMQSASYVHPATSPAPQTPEWYEIYFAAVLEADESKALIEMGRAGDAIKDRLRQLSSSVAENAREIQDLNSALTYLRLLLQNMDTESGKLLWH